jgi:hypothetical protein
VTEKAFQSEEPWTLANIPGIYLAPSIPTETSTYFWLELNENGTALTVTAVDSNQDGEIAGDEFIREEPGFWQINDDNSITITRYRYASGSDFSGACNSIEIDPRSDQECVLYNRRNLRLSQIRDNNQYALTTTQLFFYDFLALENQIPDGEHRVFIAATDNRYWQKLDTLPIDVVTNATIAEVSEEKSNLAATPTMNKVIPGEPNISASFRR